MTNLRLALFASLALLLFAGSASAAQVTVLYEAEAFTVTGMPFGVNVPNGTTVTGSFTYDDTTIDSNGSLGFGDYIHASGGGFTAMFTGQDVATNPVNINITGSTTPTVQVNYIPATGVYDTWRFYDGPRVVGLQGGIMSVNGTPNANVQAFFAGSEEDIFSSDALVNPFPSFTFGPLGTPHTFSLGDTVTGNPATGGMLLQITSVETVPEPQSIVLGIIASLGGLAMVIRRRRK